MADESKNADPASAEETALEDKDHDATYVEGDEPDDIAEEEEDVEDSTWWEDFRDFFMAFDRRTLGSTRIFLGIFLVFDMLRRGDAWWQMFSNQGVLPAHYNLWRPQSNGWSLFNAFTTRGELSVLWAVGMILSLCILFGYKTRLAQVLMAFYVASMNGRVLLIENGGYVVNNLLLLWTAFLPLGDRFSIDALIASWKAQREGDLAALNNRDTDTAPWRLKPHVSIMGPIILLQLAAIYGYNVRHKTGPAWKLRHATAVHYVLYVDRMTTPLISEVRQYLPTFVEKLLTRSVVMSEALLPIALWSPIGRVWARRAVVVMINFLHIGFGSSFVLGPFAWALCVFSTLLLGKEDWDLVYRVMRRPFRARTIRFSPKSVAAFRMCRLLKRLDRFELLSFEEDEAAKGLETTDRDGSPASGTYATAEILCALPGGPFVGELIKLPGVMAVSGLIGRFLVNPIGRLFGLVDGAKASPPNLPPTKVQPELREDAGHPTIDTEFMADWFGQRKSAGRRAILGAFLMVLGGFAFIYLPDVAKKKLEIDMTTIMFGTWNRTHVAFWGGLVVFLLGAFLVAQPFMKMNVQTPSPLARKAVRTRSVLREAFAVLMFVGAINQALVELWVYRPFKLPQPELVRLLSHKMRYLQGWFMFSPNPVMDDGTIVTDVITVDGRRLDPFSEKPPNFDLPNAKSFAYSQIWSDYFNRMHLPANTSFRKPMKEYIFRLPDRTGNPNDAVVKGKVYWVSDMNPKFGTTNSYNFKRKELFSFTNPDPDVQKRFQELTGGVDPPPSPSPATTPEPTTSAKPNKNKKSPRPKGSGKFPLIPRFQQRDSR